MLMRVSRLRAPVTVLGWGQRAGIWVQGCSIGCRGCMARDTWDPNGGRAVPIDELVAWCTAVAVEGADGLTISGGEPLEQPEVLGVLLDRLLTWRATEGRDFDLLLYSGLPLRRLQREHGAILDRLDAVIPEPFRERLAPGGRWRGSANQPLLPLTDLGRRRYADAATAPFLRELQVTVGEDGLELLGVPAPGDLAAMERALAAQGIDLGTPSWRP